MFLAGSGISILSCTPSGEWILAQKPQALTLLPTRQSTFLNKCLFIFLYACRTHSKGGCGEQSPPPPRSVPQKTRKTRSSAAKRREVLLTSRI